MKVDKRKLAAGIAAGIVLVGIVLGIKFIPQKTRDINDADGRGTKTEQHMKVEYNDDEAVLYIEGDRSDFMCVKIDGKEVPAKYLEIKDGGAEIVVSEEYLKTLDPGPHDVAVEFKDAYANDVLNNKIATTQKDKDNDKEKPAEEPTTQTEETPTQAKSNDNQQTKTAAQAPQTTTQAPPTTKHTHNYSIKGETVPPTATEDGYTVYKCSCGATTKGDWVQKTGNKQAEAKAIADAVVADANAYIRGKGIPAYDPALGLGESVAFSVYAGNDVNTEKARARAAIDGLLNLEPITQMTCVCYPDSGTGWTIDFYYNLGF